MHSKLATQRARDSTGEKNEILVDFSLAIREPMDAILGTLERVLETRLDGEQRKSLENIRSSAGKVVGMLDDIADSANIEMGKLELEYSTVRELAASIAHEIKQPLAAVATYAAAALLWLRHDPPNLERARDALQRTIQEGEHAGEIVSRVRALVNKAPPRTAAVDIDEVILEVLDLSRSALQRNGISLRTKLQGDHPLVRGDRIQLQQLVLNLVLNAVDAMTKPGTALRELSISSRREANEVLVEVRDSGRGLEAETMERIFEPFFTTKPDGMGMGLSISRSIVIAHGGRLWAMANEPGGAVFRFALPALDTKTPPEA
jgi:signal transduction histidine kinase